MILEQVLDRVGIAESQQHLLKIKREFGRYGGMMVENAKMKSAVGRKAFRNADRLIK